MTRAKTIIKFKPPIKPQEFKRLKEELKEEIPALLKFDFDDFEIPDIDLEYLEKLEKELNEELMGFDFKAFESDFQALEKELENIDIEELI